MSWIGIIYRELQISILEYFIFDIKINIFPTQIKYLVHLSISLWQCFDLMLAWLIKKQNKILYKLIIFNWLNLFTYCKKQRKKKLKNIFKVQKIIFLLFQFQTSSCQQQTNDECPAPDHCDLDLHSTSDLVPLLCGWLAHQARPLQRNVLMFWCCQADILISILLLLCNALWIICLVICII